LAVGCWLLAVGCWLLAVGCWQQNNLKTNNRTYRLFFLIKIPSWLLLLAY
jgi:hypothetical protein